MLALGISFFVLLFIGVPIALVMGASSIVYLLVNDVGREIVTIRTAGAASSFPLLAVPLFMLAGSLMNEGGLTKRLVDFCRVLVGWMKGGVAQVIVLTCMFFAAITGSAVTAASAIGGMMAPALKEEGYDLDFSASVIASAAVVGPIIPPSVPMIVLAVSCSLSAGRLLMAGAVPGVLMSLSMMVLVYIMASMGIIGEKKRDKFNSKAIFPAFGRAIAPLGMPLIILIGVGFGVFTATEAAAISVLYSLIVAGLLYRSLDFKTIKKVIADSVISTASLTFIMAFASVLSWIMAYEQLTDRMSDFLLNVTSSPVVFLIFVNIILLILGCFMDAVSTIILVAPIFVPIAIAYGIDPIHFGTVMVVNLLIGTLTPPMGVCLFVGCSLTGRRIDQVIRFLWPFILTLILILLIVTYIPSLSLFIPNLLFGVQS